jgi:hypothetical protein
MGGLIALFHVGLHCECAHHRHNMQEQNDIAYKRIGHVLAQENFEVGPQPLCP